MGNSFDCGISIDQYLFENICKKYLVEVTILLFLIFFHLFVYVPTKYFKLYFVISYIVLYLLIFTNNVTLNLPYFEDSIQY